MESGDGGVPRTATRRAVLGTAAGLAAGAAGGCVQRIRSLANRRSPEQVSLTVKTVPADTDGLATRIGRALASHLDAVGIDVEVVLMAEDELRRDVLVNHAFDVYVDRYPDHHDPDFLRSLLHSVYSEEPGWQNPFGFTDLAVDELLAEQRGSEDTARQTAVFDVQREIARQQPFAVVAFPDEVRAVRTDRFVGWNEFDPGSPLHYLALDSRGAAGTLRVTTVDERVTENFNPIAVEFRSRGTITGLLYDPLARRDGGTVRPWLAESWTWEAVSGDDAVATVRLRGGLRWHDGQPLTAADAAFTYRFLADTTLGGREAPVPAPRFRGRVSLVGSVETLDDRTLRFEFEDTSPEVAVRAFTVPLLPRHEWEPKAVEADFAGLDLFEGVTEALVWANPSPVGGGPLRFERSIPEEALTLARFDDHFLNRDPPEALAERFGGVAFEELDVRVAPSDDAAVELIAAGEADATASAAGPDVVPRIGRSDDLELLVTRSRSFYHVGFNARRSPLANPRFRRAVARLVDKRSIVNDVFDGYAAPATTPLAGTEWVPSDLRWEGDDPEVPFVGSRGTLDVASARDAFREAGYRYSDDGKLLVR